MKKILIVMSMTILIVLCSVPSFVKADDLKELVGTAYVKFDGADMIVPIYVNNYNWPGYTVNRMIISGGSYFAYDDTNSSYANVRCSLLIYVNDDFIAFQPSYNLWGHAYTTYYGFIPTLDRDYTLGNVTIYNTESEFNENLPDSLKPSLAKQRWDAFYEWYKLKFGFYPIEGSLIDMLRKLALGDETEDTVITFPTLTPTPTPSPTPTPIPVQTIFVPDGNGSTTIIYQYTDPTTNTITQSPYNPNDQYNIDINCNCDGGSDDNTFAPVPQDPTALTSSMLWADGFGVEMSDNPLTAANNSQQSLADAASEYSDSVNVVSNSFNVLPFKWLTLVGLLGGILIIAGLIRTFLGG